MVNAHQVGLTCQLCGITHAPNTCAQCAKSRSFAEIRKYGSGASYDTADAYQTTITLNAGKALANDPEVLVLLPYVPDGTYTVSPFVDALKKAETAHLGQTLYTPAGTPVVVGQPITTSGSYSTVTGNTIFTDSYLTTLFDNLRTKLAGLDTENDSQNSTLDRLQTALQNINMQVDFGNIATKDDIAKLQYSLDTVKTGLVNTNKDVSSVMTSISGINARLNDPVYGLDAINAGLKQAYEADQMFQKQLTSHDELLAKLTTDQGIDNKNRGTNDWWSQIQKALSGFASGGVIGIVIVLAVLFLVLGNRGSGMSILKVSR